MIKKYSQQLNFLAILSIFLFGGAGTFMNAAIQVMLDAWPEVSPNLIRMLVTIPPLASLPVMIIAGRVVGKKLSYRKSCLIGLGIVTVAGLAPFLASTNWYFVLFFRFLLGIGVGFLAVRNPLIMLSVPINLQTKFIGFGTVIMSLGATVAAPIVGFLANIGWRYAFLFNAIAILPFTIILLFLKEPEVVDNKTTIHQMVSEEKGAGFNWRTYSYIGLQFLSTAFLYPLLSGLATYMTNKGIGSAMIAGTLLSVYTLSGMLGNLLLQFVLDKLGRFTIPTMLSLIAIGMGIVVLLPTLPCLIAGIALSGAGFNILVSVFQIYNGQTLPVQKVASASTIILAVNQLGIFLSTYLISISHTLLRRETDVESMYMISIVLFVSLVILTTIVNVAPKIVIKEN